VLASGDVALAAEKALALYMNECSFGNLRLRNQA